MKSIKNLLIGATVGFMLGVGAMHNYSNNPVKLNSEVQIIKGKPYFITTIDTNNDGFYETIYVNETWQTIFGEYKILKEPKYRIYDSNGNHIFEGEEYFEYDRRFKIWENKKSFGYNKDTQKWEIYENTPEEDMLEESKKMDSNSI